MIQGNPFDVSIRHQRGVIVLVVLSAVIIFAPRLMISLTKDELAEELILTPASKKQHRQRNFQNWKRNKSYDRNWDSKKKSFRKPTTFFDPNQLTQAEWMEFGLSEKQAAVVISYAKRGIHSNQELENIKFIPRKVFENIKDFTKYNMPDESTKSAKTALNAQRKVLLDINHSSEQELLEIKGLGPFYVRQILKYQQQLGGFVRKEQLLEVWKMTQEIYVQIQEYITCDTKDIRQISINKASAEELQAHPYLNWNQANSIVKMRNQKGSFKSVMEIKESVIIDQETFEKVRPYLSL
jgi:DNA uptake protein ComE-like DNA-binding protein